MKHLKRFNEDVQQAKTEEDYAIEHIAAGIRVGGEVYDKNAQQRIKDEVKEKGLDYQLFLDMIQKHAPKGMFFRRRSSLTGSYMESKVEKADTLQDCPSFKEFEKAISELKKVTKKVHSELKKGTKGEIDDYIEKKIFGRDV